ncbi:MAG: rhodanese-like domain-containing protein [Bacteroidota bacterium]
MKLFSLLMLTISLGLSVGACASSTETSANASDSAAQATADVKNISAQDFNSTVEAQNAIVIDVRTPEETSQGIIKGCSMEINYNGDQFQSEIGKLDKSKTYIVYCRSGGRSAGAAQYMVDNGFTSVYNLAGGVNSWPEPLVTK